MEFEMREIRLFNGQMYTQEELAFVIEELDRRTKFLIQGKLVMSTYEMAPGSVLFKPEGKIEELEALELKTLFPDYVEEIQYEDKKIIKFNLLEIKEALSKSSSLEINDGDLSGAFNEGLNPVTEETIEEEVL